MSYGHPLSLRSNLVMLSWYGCPQVDKGIYDNAFYSCHATIKDLRKLIYGFQSGKTISEYVNPLDAAERGYLDVLIHLHSLGDAVKWTRGYWENTEIEFAAYNGHLDCVRWLHEKREEIRGEHPLRFAEGCYGSAMQSAAGRGHQHVVSWLSLNCNDKMHIQDYENTMYTAVCNGHLHIINWLSDHIPGIECSELISDAAENGHLEVVKWLCTKYEYDIEYYRRAMVKAAKNINFEIVEYLACKLYEIKKQITLTL